MAKRKLSRRQQWRIQKIQDERLDRAKNKQTKLSKDDVQLDDTLHHGIIVSHFGATLDVESQQDNHPIVRCAVRQNIETIVCGDHIIWQKLNNTADSEQIQGVITAVKPRQSVLARPDFTGQMKPIAANVDLLLIVTSPVPELNEGLVDRYLVAAELSHIKPILVLNKVDTLSGKQQQLLDERLKVYKKAPRPTKNTPEIDNTNLRTSLKR